MSREPDMRTLLESLVFGIGVHFGNPGVGLLPTAFAVPYGQLL